MPPKVKFLLLLGSQRKSLFSFRSKRDPESIFHSGTYARSRAAAKVDTLIQRVLTAARARGSNFVGDLINFLTFSFRTDQRLRKHAQLLT